MPLASRRRSRDPVPAPAVIGQWPPALRRPRSGRAAWSRFLLDETLIDRLDEIIRRPWPGVRAVPARVSSRRGGRLDLVKGQAGFDQVANPIANDGDHVTVFRDVKLIADAPVPRDDERAFFPRHDRHRRNRDLDDPVQRGDFALNSAAARYVNPGKAGGFEALPGR